MKHRGPRTEQGYANLKPGDVPKPARIKALARHIGRLHKEIMQAKMETLADKDPRTRVSYHEALVLLKAARLDLEEATQKLEDALHQSIPERKCAYCPKMFVPHRKDHIFCSKKCGANSSYHKGKKDTEEIC